jgi:hypothetical protein
MVTSESGQQTITALGLTFLLVWLGGLLSGAPVKVNGKKVERRMTPRYPTRL